MTERGVSVDGRPAAEPERDGVGERRSAVLGIGIDPMRAEELVERVARMATRGGSHLICYVNAECLNQALFDRRYRSILHQADVVYADGMGVVWASRLTERALSERITLGDALPDFCRMAAEKGLRLFFLGGVPGTAQRAAARLTERFPGLRIVDTHHGHFALEESPQVIDRINQAKPQILLAGMGVPKQEKWLWQHRAQLQVPVLWGVGALFDYYGGGVPRAPVWMRRLGLEWAFRLLLEPRRLWRRYLLGNAFFVLRTLTLLLVDAGLVTCSWLGAYWIWRWLDHPFGFTLNAVDPYRKAVILIVGTWLATCAGFGLYRRSTAMSALAELAQVIRATWVGLLSTMAVGFLFREYSFGRPVVVLAGVLTFALLSASRLLAIRIMTRSSRNSLKARRSNIRSG